MNRIQTKLHNTIDKIKGLRGTVTNTKKKSEFAILFIILAFIALPFIGTFGLTFWGFSLGITAYISSVFVLVGGYKYFRSKDPDPFWDRLTIICLLYLILLFIIPVILFYIFTLITTKIHLNSLSRNIDLFLLRFVLFIFAFGIIFTASGLLPDDNLAVKLTLVLVFVIYTFLKKLLVYAVAPRKERRYSRYKINREFKYIDDFILSLCLLIKLFITGQQLDTFFSFFLIISAIYSTIKATEYFKFNIRHTNCLQTILSDLENCIDCLDSADPQSELRLRIHIDTTFLRFCYVNGSKKVKKAIESIYSLVFSEDSGSDEGQGKNDKIHRPFTYNCTAAQMRKRIENTLNEMVKAL